MEESLLKTRKELADQLNVSISTLYRTIRKEQLNLPTGRLLRPSEYQPILDLFEYQR